VIIVARDSHAPAERAVGVVAGPVVGVDDAGLAVAGTIVIGVVVEG
jgi:hypothetical protein